MADPSDLAERLRHIEHREAIRDLVAGYGKVVDDRDMDGLRALFAPDVRFGSVSSTRKIEGRDAVVAYYESRYADMPLSNHFTHDHVIKLDSDTRAHGYVNSHVEMVREGEPMLVALRYADMYVYHESAWKFQERITSIFYYMKTADYLSKLSDRKRNIGSGEALDADWPEGIDTWRAYENRDQS